MCAHCNDASVEVFVFFGVARIPVWAFREEGVCHQKPIAMLHEIDFHSVSSGLLGAGTTVCLAPDITGLGDPPECVRINRLKHLRDCAENVEADHGFACELRSVVRLSEGIPCGICINESVFGIQNVADGGTLFSTRMMRYNREFSALLAALRDSLSRNESFSTCHDLEEADSLRKARSNQTVSM